VYQPISVGANEDHFTALLYTGPIA
jgi:hypothetical protein